MLINIPLPWNGGMQELPIDPQTFALIPVPVPLPSHPLVLPSNPLRHKWYHSANCENDEHWIVMVSVKAISHSVVSSTGLKFLSSLQRTNAQGTNLSQWFQSMVAVPNLAPFRLVHHDYKVPISVDFIIERIFRDEQWISCLLIGTPTNYGNDIPSAALCFRIVVYTFLGWMWSSETRDSLVGRLVLNCWCPNSYFT